MITRYHRRTSSIRRFGSCPICQTDTKLVADHCHQTGLTRAPICRKCNMLLGLAQDRPELLRTAASYLEQYATLHAQHHSRA